jgi:hypothetical protein
MPSWPFQNVLYRRPPYVHTHKRQLSDSPSSSKTEEGCVTSGNDAFGNGEIPSSGGAAERSERAVNIVGIPEQLSFDKIVKDGCCPPCTKRDFLNYVKYVMHSGENLQFFLWYQEYLKRFKAAPENQTVLSPPWSQAQNERIIQQMEAQRQAALTRGNPTVRLYDNAAAEVNESDEHDPFDTPDHTPPGTAASEGFEDHALDGNTLLGSSHGQPPTTSGTTNANSTVGSSTLAGTTLVNSTGGPSTLAGTTLVGSSNIHIPGAYAPSLGSSSANTFVQPGSSAGNRSAVSSNPSRAADIYSNHGIHKPFTIQPFREELDKVLETFIAENSPLQLNLSDRQRKSVINGISVTTHPSVFQDILWTVEQACRQQAHPNFIRWTICNGNPPRWMFARYLGGFCIIGGVVAEILLTLSRAARAYRALPLILITLGIATLIAAMKGMCVVLHGLHHRHLRPWELFEDAEDTNQLEHKMSLSSDEYLEIGPKDFLFPWQEKYKKRNLIRKIFDREVWIQEPALRQIQDRIFMESLIVAFLIALVVTAVFLAVPKGNFY